MNFRVLTINVAGTGLDWFDQRRATLVKTINELSPDAICMQELKILPDEDYDQARDIAGLTGFNCVAFAPYGNTEEFKSPSGMLGIGILSRTPFEEVQSRRLPPGKEKYGARVALISKLHIANQSITIVNTHLSWRKDEVQIREQQVNEILRELDDFHSIVVSGDFNACPEEPGIELMRENFIDTFESLNPDKDGITWTKNNPLVKSFRRDGRIDYIFCSHDLNPFSSEVVLNRGTPIFPSDHFGVMTEFSI